MKKIDLSSMSEDELRALNREIVRILDFYSSMRRKRALMAFRVGDRVAFDTDSASVVGTVIRINQKTASIDADDGRQWRVSPAFLRKSEDIRSIEPKTQANLFQLPSPERNSH